jgi:lactate dehydrogenase-like 2-hydroxyacid dehydrogenase
MLLSLLRDTTWYDSKMKQGNGSRTEGPSFRAESAVLTVGMFGLGGSGKLFAKIMGGGFGAELIAFDPTPPLKRLPS